MNNLPAYLQGRMPSTSSMAATLVGNLGSGSPPYISIRNNKFTAVDSTGAEKPVGGYNQQPDAYGAVGLYVDVVLIDNNEHTSKVWFEKPFSDNQDGWLPPDCWSDNGIGASRNAAKPQSLLCNQCLKNDWGSKVSAVSGKGIKACSDVQKMAAIIPGDDIIYQVRIPPNSRTALRDYVLKFTGQPFDVRDVVTRIWFDQQTIGTLKFVGLGWLDEGTVAQRDKALAEKKTDALVGRGDLPVQQLLAAPAQTQQVAAVQYAPQASQPGVTGLPGQQPAPLQPSTASAAATMQQPQTAAPSAATAQTAEPQRRRRRTRAEIDAAGGHAPAQQTQPMQPAAQAPGPFTQGPAIVAAIHAQPGPTPNPQPGPAAQPNNFGMQAAQNSTPEIDAALKDIFG